MPRPEVEALAARLVPGSGTPQISVLRTGLVHETYRVLRQGMSYALRVPCSMPIELGLDLSWEARVLERAAQAGLAPALRYADPAGGITVVDWVEGRSWIGAEPRLPANLSRMADLLRRLHALPAPMPARFVTPLKWVEQYTEALRRSQRGAAAGLAARLQATARARAGALTAMNCPETALCHSDLHVLNVIDRGGSLVLLDWEYAHVSDPLWDLAAWSANNDFDAETRAVFAKAYRGRPPTQGELVRLALLEWLYDFVCLLWSEIYLSTSGSDLPHAAGEHDSVEAGIRARAEVLKERLEASPR